MIKVYRIAEDGRRLASGAFQASSENASLTVKLTARSVSGLPGRRTDWNTGADTGCIALGCQTSMRRSPRGQPLLLRC